MGNSSLSDVRREVMARKTKVWLALLQDSLLSYYGRSGKQIKKTIQHYVTFLCRQKINGLPTVSKGLNTLNLLAYLCDDMPISFCICMCILGGTPVRKSRDFCDVPLMGKFIICFPRHVLDKMFFFDCSLVSH